MVRSRLTGEDGLARVVYLREELADDFVKRLPGDAVRLCMGKFEKRLLNHIC